MSKIQLCLCVKSKRAETEGRTNTVLSDHSHLKKNFFLDYRRVSETLQMGAAVISAEGQRFLSALVVHLKSVWRTTDCYLWLSVFLYVLTITSNYVRECEWFSEWEKKKVICLYFMYVRNKTRRVYCYRKIINDELILLPLWSVPTQSVLFLLRRSSSPTITFLKNVY